MEGKIPQELYERIVENTVISAVDAVIYHEGKVLLAYRKQKPMKGQWCIPGGRQEKGETGEEAVVRKVKQEVGLDVEVRKLVGVYDVVLKETPFPNVKTGVHHVVRVYLVAIKDKNQQIKLNETQSKYKWIDKIEANLHPYVKKTLKDSHVFD